VLLGRLQLWRGPHAAVKQLAEDFARYFYLPRLHDSNVLAEAISEGLGLISWMQNSFAYADGWDQEKQRYRGLQVGRQIMVNIEGDGLLVRPTAAIKPLRYSSRQGWQGTSRRLPPLSCTAQSYIKHYFRFLTGDSEDFRLRLCDVQAARSWMIWSSVRSALR
jgi:hypothetical protein